MTLVETALRCLNSGKIQVQAKSDDLEMPPLTSCRRDRMTTKTKPELQVQLQAAIPALTDDHFAYHATDLYVVALPGVREFLSKYKLECGNSTQTVSFSGFMSQEGSNWAGAGKFCYDIPFMGNWPERKAT